jgi:hypothetical protein
MQYNLNIHRGKDTNPVISKASKLSFPQVKRVGNPSENIERFRTSRNDKLTNECVFTYDLLSNSGNMSPIPLKPLIAGYLIIMSSVAKVSLPLGITLKRGDYFTILLLISLKG